MEKKEYVERFYRNWCVKEEDIQSYNVKYKESDLFIKSDKDFSKVVVDLLRELHKDIINYSSMDPRFLRALEYYETDILKPCVVQLMFDSAKRFNVGPMAAVAGAISQIVGEKLSECSNTVIIENGGDIFIKSYSETTIGIFAGESPFSERIGIKIAPTFESSIGICTSSGTVGPSKSFGIADAAVILAENAALADAAATALGNLVQMKTDIKELLEDFVNKHKLIGGMIIRGTELAVYKVEILKIS
ncbi:MAG: UPF0280 family protein [Thermotogae bacterium]|nr:UPF0280 family protein [Thermotogota bacterium]